ncbi:30S ribosomal protein S11 [bacterium AB1]|nr:30S ribosomal protein S11 [bacterium AB1]
MEKKLLNKKKKFTNKKEKKVYPQNIIVKIKALLNNIRIDITDTNGNVLLWRTAGTQGMKNSKKSTPFSALVVSKEVCNQVNTWNVQNCVIQVNGFGAGRETALRMLVENFGSKVTYISDTLRLAYNGVRPKKQRRI